MIHLTMKAAMNNQKSASRRAGQKAKQALHRRLREALGDEGRHFTRQRAAFFEYLSRVDHHPTAEEVFLAVKRELPRISLATVYKNLEALAACGTAAKLTYG